MVEAKEAGCVPVFAQPHKAKGMMGLAHGTNKPAAEAVGTVTHDGPLPMVRMSPGGMRDEQEILRSRITFS